MAKARPPKILTYKDSSGNISVAIGETILLLDNAGSFRGVARRQELYSDTETGAPWTLASYEQMEAKFVEFLALEFENYVSDQFRSS